jgi:glutathione synthase/RimK-type ligase-like ATP-grasp enzyme
MKLYPYNEGSASAKALATALGIKRLKREGKPIKVDIVLNWGCSSDNFPRGIECEEIINDPNCVRLATNKLKSFNALRWGNVTIPDFTESREEAAKWLAEGVTVVERHTLTGHSGEGVRIVALGQALQQAPLYVKYIPKKDEYRVHVFREKAFFVQQKKRKQEVPDDKINWQVRNHQNGFIYANQDVALPQKALDQAIASIKALGLDFGAVDIIYNQKSDTYYVLEVNTACGLTGTTLDKYVEVFKEFV